MSQEKVERNREIMRMYTQDGCKRRDIAEYFDMGLPAVNAIISRERARLGPQERTRIVEDLVREINESRNLLAELRDAPLPPAFSVKGSALVDPRDGSIVEDGSSRIAATHALKSQQDALTKLLGLNSPDKRQTETSVHYVIEGMNIEDLK